MNNYDYPIGSDTSAAPWNQKDNEPEEFEVCISNTLSKTVKVNTTDYLLEFEVDEDNNVIFNINVEDTDWLQAYNSDYYTLQDLLHEVQKYLKEEIDHCKNEIKKRKLKKLYNECIGWEEDEKEVVQC